MSREIAGLLVVGVLASVPVDGAISGRVLEAGSGSPGVPIAGARVHLQADPESPVVVSASDGGFTLPVEPLGAVVVTAAVAYDRSEPASYTTSGVFAFNGQTGVEIRLAMVPVVQNTAYTPPGRTECVACHAEQVFDWEGSNHSFAGVDEWVLDLLSGSGTPGGGAGYVFRDLHDPGETGFCATCHAPLEDLFDPGNVFLDEVAGPAALEGVTCLACHQMDSVNESVDALHHLGNSTYRFPLDPISPTSSYVWGPLDDVNFGGMRASFAPVFRESRLCASCHQYTNPTTGAPGQNTFREWQESAFAVPGPGYRTCQDCHMPEAEEPSVICLVGDPPIRPPSQHRSHAMVGATPDSLVAALQLEVQATQLGGRAQVIAKVTNAGAGHAFPTGVSVRNALLRVSAQHQGQPLVQVAGPEVPFWADDAVPGKQAGDHAGDPGKGFAKILEGRIDGKGPVMRPVLFIDAEGVYSDTLIPAGETDVTEVEFRLPPTAQSGDEVEVDVRLLYRRAFRAVAVTKGWTETPQGGPIEIEVAAESLRLTVDRSAAPLDIPALDLRGVVVLLLLLALSGTLIVRRSVVRRSR